MRLQEPCDFVDFTRDSWLVNCKTSVSMQALLDGQVTEGCKLQGRMLHRQKPCHLVQGMHKPQLVQPLILPYAMSKACIRLQVLPEKALIERWTE